MSAAFQRYVEWNELAVDDSAFLDLKRNDIDAAAACGRRFFEASAYLSLSIERLSRAFDARFVLLVREPLAVISSFISKGWYAFPVAHQDPTAALGYAELGQPHHGFSRLAPRGEARRTWSDLSRAGQLAWFWAAINSSVLDVFGRLPPDRKLVLQLERLDFDAYANLAELMSIRPTLARARFEEICGKRPGRFAVTRDVGFTEPELREVFEQCGRVAQQFGYSVDPDSSTTSHAVIAAAATPFARSPQSDLPSLLATIGPRNSDADAIDWMIDAGVRGFRINFARLSLEANMRVLERVQAHPAAAGLSVIVDLPGRKMRTARFHDGPSRSFRAGETIRMVRESEPPSADSIPVATSEFFGEVAAGDRITFSASDIVLRVIAVDDNDVTARVLEGGLLWKASGIWIAGPYRPYDQLWSRDRELISVLAHRRVSLAVSFADTPAVIREARALADSPVRLVAKIESPAAIAGWPQLVNEADAVMIGRDDLSRFLTLDTIDEWMSRRSEDAVHASKPFIAASHYMDSVVTSGTLSERDEDVVRHVFARGWILCLSETGQTEHWRTLIRAALALAATQ